MNGSYSRFDPFGPGKPSEELWGRSQGRKTRKRTKPAQERRAAKRWARRKRMPLKQFLREAA